MLFTCGRKPYPEKKSSIFKNIWVHINQQKDALNDYKISNIPKKAREDTNQIVIDIREILGVEIMEDDVSVSHCLLLNKCNPDRP